MIIKHPWCGFSSWPLPSPSSRWSQWSDASNYHVDQVRQIIMLIRCAKAQQMFFLRRSPRPTCSSSASAFHSRKELRWSWWSLEGLRWWWWWWKWWWWSSLCGLPPHLCLSLKEIIILTDGKAVLVLMGVWDRALQIGTNIIYWYWYWYWWY